MFTSIELIMLKRLVLKMKDGCNLELQMLETMTLFGRSEISMLR